MRIFATVRHWKKLNSTTAHSDCSIVQEWATCRFIYGEKINVVLMLKSGNFVIRYCLLNINYFNKRPKVFLDAADNKSWFPELLPAPVF